MHREALSAWLDAYGRAWEAQDPEAATALFTEEAVYQETPFERHMEGLEAIRKYWAEIPEYHRDVRFGHDILSVEGDEAIVHWWASYLAVATGDPTKLDGIFLLRFDERGRCSSLREWWHAHPRPSF